MHLDDATAVPTDHRNAVYGLTIMTCMKGLKPPQHSHYRPNDNFQVSGLTFLLGEAALKLDIDLAPQSASFLTLRYQSRT